MADRSQNRDMSAWFRESFGFQESDYDSTQQQLIKQYDLTEQTISNQKIGQFSIPALQELRHEVSAIACGRDGKVTFENIVGDVRELHYDPQNEGSTFQVASQFNLLEFPSPDIVPERGVTGYAYDNTQGPACALACPAGTVFRNYLIPMSDNTLGQRRDMQINTLSDLESRLPIDYWEVQNGYIESTEAKLTGLNLSLLQMADEKRELLKACIRIGAHRGVQVINSEHTVNQVYASAVSAGYSAVDTQHWEPLARLVLESAYESTLLIGLLSNQDRTEQGLPARPVYLTKLGGGVFGNRSEWIESSIQKAIDTIRSQNYALDIKLVHYRNIEDAYSGIE